jgi:cytidylate kinase
MNIITISREFGSGGRELGKRIADVLGYDYYDREIIATIAKRHNLNENYVEHALTSTHIHEVPLTFKHSFTSPMYVASPKMDILLEQKKVIDEIAEKGKNCVIVGRNADVLLRGHEPFNIFVCAEMDERIKRCIDRAEENESKNPKDIKKKIIRIDKNRKRTRYLISEKDWGSRKSYHLIVNTTGWDMAALSESVAPICDRWFKEREEKQNKD